jgi:hypothetical protein
MRDVALRKRVLLVLGLVRSTRLYGGWIIQKTLAGHIPIPWTARTSNTPFFLPVMENYATYSNHL